MESVSAKPPLESLGDVSAADVFRIGAATIFAMLIAVAGTVVFRRLAGALVEPLQPAALLTAGALIAGAVAAIRVGWSRTKPRDDWTMMGVTSLAAMSLFASLCLPGTSPAVIAVASLMLAAEESCFWFRAIRRARNRRPVAADVESQGSIDVDMTNDVASETDNPLAESDYEESFGLETMPGNEVTQQIIRARTAEGGEIVTGRLRACFSAGQRTGSVHLAFCPSLESTPKVEIEQIEGPSARIKTAQVLPYGIRLDVKLASSCDEPTDILIQLSAISS